MLTLVKRLGLVGHGLRGGKSAVRVRSSASRRMQGEIATLATLLVAATMAFPTVAHAALPQGNLLQNGNAEAGSCTDTGDTVEPIPGWTTAASSEFTVTCYGASGGFPGTDVSTAIGGGAGFFAGGPSGAQATATQTVDVSAAASDIDAGSVQANLSGYLGGYADQHDNMVVTATFLDGSGGALGTPVQIGPVTMEDRNSKSTLLSRAASGVVPAGTRSVSVAMTSTRTDGSYNDGYADNLSLTLTPPGTLHALDFFGTVTTQASYGPGEAPSPASPLGNVEVVLLDSAGHPLDQVTTASDGAYRIALGTASSQPPTVQPAWIEVLSTQQQVIARAPVAGLAGEVDIVAPRLAAGHVVAEPGAPTTPLLRVQVVQRDASGNLHVLCSAKGQHYGAFALACAPVVSGGGQSTPFVELIESKGVVDTAALGDDITLTAQKTPLHAMDFFGTVKKQPTFGPGQTPMPLRALASVRVELVAADGHLVRSGAVTTTDQNGNYHLLVGAGSAQLPAVLPARIQVLDSHQQVIARASVDGSLTGKVNLVAPPAATGVVVAEPGAPSSVQLKVQVLPSASSSQVLCSASGENYRAFALGCLPAVSFGTTAPLVELFENGDLVDTAFAGPGLVLTAQKLPLHKFDYFGKVTTQASYGPGQTATVPGMLAGVTVAVLDDSLHIMGTATTEQDGSYEVAFGPASRDLPSDRPAHIEVLSGSTVIAGALASSLTGRVNIVAPRIASGQVVAEPGAPSTPNLTVQIVRADSSGALQVLCSAPGSAYGSFVLACAPAVTNGHTPFVELLQDGLVADTDSSATGITLTAQAP